MNTIGKVYKIISCLGNEVYIGSTFQSFNRRFTIHKSQYKHWKKGKGAYTSSFYLFNQYGISNCSIILIREYEVCDREHLEVYESLWILKLKGINENIPFRIKRLSDKQYREEHKEERKEERNEYTEEHKKEQSEYNKRWEMEHKEERREYFKQYREEHKEKRREYQKKYSGELVHCISCDSKIRKGDIKDTKGLRSILTTLLINKCVQIKKLIEIYQMVRFLRNIYLEK